MTLLSELIDIPEQVHKGDFVLKLTSGVEQADQTLDQYVVTEQLARCFDEALGFIKGAVQARASKAAYLHGSFGSGKSHFMAVLHLLLQGNARARALPELAPAVARHAEWMDGKRFLLVPYHMIGARSMESAILGRYAEHVATLHPEAPPPAIYKAEGLFEDARNLRERMGDERFFHGLNRAGGGEGGWGKLAEWDATSFVVALTAPPNDRERLRLVSALVDTYFRNYRDVARGSEEAFVSLDEGLAIISAHAQGLGYDALILFLDELILWLASHAADLAFVNREGQKLVKLTEAERADRPIPVISFVARQRDLRELVGTHIAGAEQLAFGDVLGHWEGRFHTITLEDRNLAAIAERRLLKPRSEAARQRIDAAFAETQKAGDAVRQTLLTSTGDPAQFRQVYPFSPAFVQALVAISGALQRERTALKVMAELLTQQRHTLRLGDVVPVGDLFDLVTDGDEVFTDVMRLNATNAVQLYRRKLLPLLARRHEIAVDELDRLPADDPRLRRFRAEDRLIKTLLLAALVPEVEALRGLTPARLAALNHGSIRAPIPGQEGQVVLKRCQELAAEVGEIRVGDGVNPTIAVQLTGVDTEGIVQKALNHDSTGERRRAVKELLYQQLGLGMHDELFTSHAFLWRGTERRCDILYTNVREATDESLRARGGDWLLVIDFPFDEGNYKPIDDLARLQRYRDEKPPTTTIAWVPSFLSAAALADLGRYVILEHVLTGERFAGYASHLNAVEQGQARLLLDNQRNQLRQRLIGILESAYGIAAELPGMVDPGHERAAHVQSLQPTFQPRLPVGGTLGAALEQLLDQALASQFPAHPHFGTRITMATLRKVLDELRRAAKAPQGRIEVERPLRPLLAHVAEPLQLGTMHEAHFVLDRRWVQELNRRRDRDGGPLSVGKLRAWLDEPEPRGLPEEVANLVILTYAEVENYAFRLHGGPATPALDRLSDELELRQVELPSPEQWQRARERAEKVLGVVPEQFLSAGNVAAFADQVRGVIERHRGDCERLCRRLREVLSRAGLAADQTPRVRTADAVLALIERVRQANGPAIVDAVAVTSAPTTLEAMGTSLKRAGDVCAALDAIGWDIFATLEEAGIPDAAAPVHARVHEVLAADELAIALAPALREAQDRALALIKEALRIKEPPPPPPPPPADPRGGAPRPSPAREGQRCGLDAAGVRTLLGELEAALAAEPGARLTVSWTIEGTKRR